MKKLASLLLIVLLIAIGISIFYIVFRKQQTKVEEIGTSREKSMPESYIETFNNIEKLKLKYLMIYDLEYSVNEERYSKLSVPFECILYKVGDDILVNVSTSLAQEPIIAYKKGQKIVTCQEEKCDEIEEALNLLSISLIFRSPEVLLGKNITNIEEKDIRGRTSKCFTINETIGKFIGIFPLGGQTVSENVPIPVEICIDNEYGYVSLLNFASNATQNGEKITFSILSNVVEVSTNISEEEQKAINEILSKIRTI